MFPRRLLAALVLFCVQILPAHAAESVPAERVVLGNSAVPVGGPWAFHLGDDIAWSSPGIDDSSWERLTPDQPWDLQGHWAYDGFAWYRRTINISAAEDLPGQLALWIPALGDAYEVYWNGVRVGGSGRLPPHPKWEADSGAIIPLGNAQSGVLALRVWRAPFLSIGWNEYGGLRATPQLGLASEISLRVANEKDQAFRFDFSYLILLPLYILAAVISLLAWFSDRRKAAYLCMAAFSLSMIAMLIASTPLGWRAPVPLLLSVNRAGIGIREIALWFMLLWLLDLWDLKFLRRLTKLAAWLMLCIVVGYVLLLVALWPSPWGRLAQSIEQFLAALYALTGFLSLAIVAVALLRGRRLTASRWVLAVATLITQLLVVARNVSIVGLRYTHSHAIDYLLSPLYVFRGMAIHRHTATDTLVLAALVYAFYWDSQEHRRRHEHLEQEFRNARELQRVLIPESFPDVPGYALTSAYRPALEVGGDFFQIIPLATESTLVVVGDVSGKGLGAAMAVSLILGAVRALAEEHSSPAELLDILNRKLCGRLQGGFATCIVLRLEPGGRCKVASAGHPSPMLNDAEVDLPGALPLGLTPHAGYVERSLQLEATDRLSLYTDGLLEARNASGELFGFDRVKSTFAGSPRAEEVVEDAVSFGQEDDITVLILTAQA